MKIPLVILATVALAITPAWAEKDGPVGGSGKDLLEALDANSDGTLDPAELSTLDPDLLAKLLSIYDANTDGSITAAEFQNADPAEDENHFDAEGIVRIDANGDGVIDAAEIAVLAADFQTKLLAAFDTNKDGLIDADEIAAAQDFPEDNLANLDENEDGTLDDSELNVLDPGIQLEFLAAFDRNRDGVITRPEVKVTNAKRLAHFQAQRAFVLGKKFDRNGDHKLGIHEKVALQNALRTRKSEVFKRFDLNKNGKLEKAEKAAFDDVINGRKPKKVTL